MQDLYQGVVFFIQHREVTSNKPHYLVVLNPDPGRDELVVFGVITSGIANAKKRVEINGENPETLVILTPLDYSELEHESVIDCNSPVKYSKWEFEQAFGQLNSKRKSNMPVSICEEVIKGISLSKQVPPRIKKILNSRSA